VVVLVHLEGEVVGANEEGSLDDEGACDDDVPQ
jgi:hypothetical protein